MCLGRLLVMIWWMVWERLGRLASMDTWMKIPPLEPGTNRMFLVPGSGFCHPTKSGKGGTGGPLNKDEGAVPKPDTPTWPIPVNRRPPRGDGNPGVSVAGTELAVPGDAPWNAAAAAAAEAGVKAWV